MDGWTSPSGKSLYNFVIHLGDGRDILWISSGWANEEQGVVWSYNVSKGISKFRNNRLLDSLDDDIQLIFKTPYEIAKVFALGNEPKVSPTSLRK